MERRKYPPELKRAAVDRVVAGEGATAVARELGIRRKFLYQWRSQELGSASQPKPVPTAESEGRDGEVWLLKKKVEELERLAGRQSAELDFFVSALRSRKAARPLSVAATGKESIA